MTTPPFAEELDYKKVKSVFSNVLDPEFVVDIRAKAQSFDAKQNNADLTEWEIAERVNSDWDEHRNIVFENTNDLAFPTKKEYYAEVSRVMNLGLKRKRWTDSGETLRRICELQATYANFEEVEEFLEATSKDHLYKAKQLAKNGKVSVPILALAEAIKNKWTADEMHDHYDPPSAIHEYDKVSGWLANMQNKDTWKWLKSQDTIKQVIHHAKEIKRLIDEDK